MKNKEMNDLAVAVGTMADVVALFYRELLHAGVEKGVAAAFTLKLIEVKFGDNEMDEPSKRGEKTK